MTDDCVDESSQDDGFPADNLIDRVVPAIRTKGLCWTKKQNIHTHR